MVEAVSRPRSGQEIQLGVWGRCKPPPPHQGWILDLLHAYKMHFQHSKITHGSLKRSTNFVSIEQETFGPKTKLVNMIFHEDKMTTAVIYGDLNMIFHEEKITTAI